MMRARYGMFLWAQALFHVLPQLIQLYNFIWLAHFVAFMVAMPSGRVRLDAAACHQAAFTRLVWWQWVHCTPTNQGVFHYSASWCPLEACVVRGHTSCEGLKLELCMCAQRHAWGAHAGFRLEVLTVEVISGFVFFVSLFFGELAGCWWKRRLGLALLAPGAFLGGFWQSAWLWMVNWSFMTSRSTKSFCWGLLVVVISTLDLFP